MTIRVSAAIAIALLGLIANATACSTPDRMFVPSDAAGDGRDATNGDATIDGAIACTTDFGCDDRIACTVDHCRAGVCSHEPCTDCCAAGQQCVAGYGCGRAPMPCTMDSECVDSVRCTLDRCRDGRFCEHLGQDGLCATGEICLAALGCIPRPPDHCRSDVECTMTPCLGTWYCSEELGCQFRSLTDCDDGDVCTTDTCVDARGGCQHARRDADMDGHPAMSCGGDDCDDMNPARHPGAAEICGNLVDEDCNGSIDDNCCMPGATCMTTCGTTGTTTCVSPSMPGPCSPPVESCNGRDDDCDGMTDEGCCTPGAACMTTCGSTGVGTCTAAGMAGPCTPPPETCNGRDDDCDGAVDQTYACARGGVSACMTTCGSTSTRTCGTDCTLGPCVIPPETCNGRDDDCDSVVDNGFACPAGSTGSCPTSCGSTGRRTCLGSCAWDVCVPPAEVCNGIDDNCNTTCDEGFTCCAGSTRDCTALGFVSGTATCRADCGGWNTAGCSNCGNLVRDGSEQCDANDLGSATCATQGFGSGTLRCRAGCTFDTTGCSACGNGTIQAPEQCDTTNLNGATCASLGMGFNGGTLRCGPLCTFDTSMCTRPFNPTGTWVVAPGVNQYCAFGAVSISFGNLVFNDTGTGLSVSGGGINCMMTGPSARVTRMVNVTCSLPGGCTETYTLTGTFTDDTHFSGTFRAGFTGSGCFDCVTRMSTVTGSR